MKEYSRRALLGMTGLTMVAGCIRNGNESDTTENRSKDQTRSGDDSESKTETPERCDLRYRERPGRGESVSEIINLVVTENPDTNLFKPRIETENTDNLERDSAGAAAQIAFRKVAAEFGTEMNEETLQWISPAAVYDGGSWSPQVVIEAKDIGRPHEGREFQYCPPAEYEFRSVVEIVPNTATVTLQSPDGDELHKQEHTVVIVQRIRNQD